MNAPDPRQEHDSKLHREAEFWDKTAQTNEARDPELYRVAMSDRSDRSVPWLPYLGFDAYLGSVLDHLGDVRGKRILDLGCGTGFLASLLAANGAMVDAVDVSEASLEVARWRAEISGTSRRITFHQTAAESLDFPDSSFDAACGAFVLHHLNLSMAAPELRRVLRPGAPAAFIETAGGSPILMAARRLLPGKLGIEKASSSDEAPLGRDARAALGDTFGSSVKFVYSETLFFRMLSYLPPLHHRPAQLVLSAMDAALHAIAPLRRWSYYASVCVTAPGH